jgi:hypothetical protein
MESSTEFLENEKYKIFTIVDENIELLEKMTKFIELLDKVELSIGEKVDSQIQELNSVQNMSSDLFIVFQKICQNFIKIKKDI